MSRDLREVLLKHQNVVRPVRQLSEGHVRTGCTLDIAHEGHQVRVATSAIIT